MAARTDGSLGAGLRALLADEVRIALVAATLLIGAGAAALMVFLLPTGDGVYAGTLLLVQLVMSVLTAFSTALLTHDLRDEEGPFRGRRADLALPGRWLVAGLYGVAIGTYGAVVAAVATAIVVDAPAGVDPWAGAAPAVLGSLVVQLVPVGVGCGAGLLIRRAGLACLATVVVPVLVTVLVGNLAPRGTADWVTPLGAAGHLVPGPMGVVGWAQWIVVAALWVVLPNWLGSRRLRRRSAARPD